MSQAMFARLLNVSPKTVQSWEHGIRKPSQAALRLIQVFEPDPDGVFSVVGMSGPRGEDTKKANKRGPGREPTAFAARDFQEAAVVSGEPLEDLRVRRVAIEGRAERVR